EFAVIQKELLHPRPHIREIRTRLDEPAARDVVEVRGQCDGGEDRDHGNRDHYFDERESGGGLLRAQVRSHNCSFPGGGMLGPWCVPGKRSRLTGSERARTETVADKPLSQICRKEMTMA